MVERWNDTAAAYCIDNTAPSFFEQVSTAALMRAAVVFEGELVSYGELEKTNIHLGSQAIGVAIKR